MGAKGIEIAGIVEVIIGGWIMKSFHGLLPII
jgi:hypothetical protein